MMTDARRLFISFSGGETSAFMAQLLIGPTFRHLYDEVRVVFANTGEENEQTLQFVEACDKLFGLGVVWVEAEVHHGARRSNTARVVDFTSASRNGEPFEQSIAKYGIPNHKFKECTRNLKLNPLTDYLASVGWARGTYDTAIGIRIDEIDRMSSRAAERRIVYPLVNWLPMSKPDINAWWSRQPFRLGLKGYQGNCRWCWKKSFRKHLTLIEESPDVYAFPRRMEQLYGHVGAEFHKVDADRPKPLPADYRRTFFRGNRSTEDLFAMYAAQRNTFQRATDDAVVYPAFDPALDVGSGCEESCEVFADEDMGEQ